MMTDPGKIGLNSFNKFIHSFNKYLNVSKVILFKALVTKVTTLMGRQSIVNKYRI